MEPANYQPEYIRELFDEMAETYGLVNLVTSFGFSARWRWQCVAQAAPQPGAQVLDLMAGMAELGPYLAPRIGPTGAIHAVDLSPVMCARARQNSKRWGVPAAVEEADVLAGTLPAASADVVVSSFGLKTFSPAQRRVLAREIVRLLRPGGRLSLVEISVPPAALLRWPYLFYLQWVIPILGWLLLGNPDNYRMLGVYTTAFGDCRQFGEELAAAGLEVQLVPYFFGCATGLVGQKP